MSDVIAGNPALTAEEVSNLTRETNYGTWRFQKTWKPLYIADAEGCWITDGAGKRYLDFSAQLMCVNLGHKNHGGRRVHWPSRRASWPLSARSMRREARARLSAKLLEVLPAGLEKFFFATSGTEANEAAFKIARMYHGQEQDHLALSLVSRINGGIDCGHRRSAALGHGARRQRSTALSSRQRRTATTAPSSTPIPAATLHASTTSST